MALFGKKKLSLDEILELVKNLSPEEQAQIKAKMEDLDKAEDEREIDKIEKEKSSSNELKDEKGEEVDEESEEIGKDVDEVEEEIEDDEKPEVEETEEDQEEELGEVEEENEEKILSTLTNRVNELENQVKELLEIKAKMEEFTNKQMSKFGYKGSVPNSRKDYRDMSSAELSNELRTEI